MIYPENFEEKTGFIFIRQWLKELCLSDLGREAVDEIQFVTESKNIITLLKQVQEFKQIHELEDQFPLDHYFDARGSLKKLKVEGLYLDETEIYELGKSLNTIKLITNFIKKTDEKYPEMLKICLTVSIHNQIINRVEEILTPKGRLKDNASASLKDIRNQVKAKENDVSRVIQRILKKAQASGLIDEDASINIRDGRPVIPVSANNKRMIRGYIHDESASGKTVFIEPAEVMELNNEIRELKYAEKREIIKILIAFTDEIRPYKEELSLSFEFLKTIDFIRAKALLAIKIPSVNPRITQEPLVNWSQALHPVLYITHKQENKAVVPLDIKLTSSDRLLIISGPNAGGKSVCLKTVGIIQYMVQCGMLAPMKEDSEMGVFDKIAIDIGDEQSIENDLSTYSSHLLNMKYFLKSSDNKSLLLIDEFGSGTEPNIGGAIAEAILQKLNDKNAFGVITTHYSNLKHFAFSTEGIVNGAMMYDTQKMKPLFKLDIGGPGSSFAFEIARNIGISEEILEIASGKIGGKHIEYDKHLREILRDKRYWERKRMNIRKVEKQLELKEEKYNQELEKINTQKSDAIKKSREEAENILKDLNRKIENTIRTIKESNADKEKTRIARKELEDEVAQMKKSLEKKEPVKILKKKVNPENQKVPKEITVGTKVRMKGQDQAGEVVQISRNRARVVFGDLVTTTKTENLEPVSDAVYKKLNPKIIKKSPTENTFKKKLDFKPYIDFRGKRAEEVIQELQSFLDQAIMVNARELKILHGKGNGILKEVIRDYLRTQDVVSYCKDEHVEFGGSGITVVGLDI